MKILVSLLLVGIALLLLTCGSIGVPKQGLRVLFVGDDPSRDLPPMNFAHGGGIAENRYEEDMRSRMPAFVKLLKQHFKEVKAVDAREYTEEMTREYDVVIFDGLPAPVVPGVKRVKSGNGVNTGLLPEETRRKLENVVDTKELFSARYFSDTYDKPTLFVGDRAGIMGAAIGLKLDWYCRCLDAHAFDLREDHPVFHTPLEVPLTRERRITPPSALNGAEGAVTSGTMSMWRVQREGFHEGGHDRYRQGLVARGDGFEDSPDAEVICGGVSDKVRNAVAIGRHGNFLMWGFAADPSYMTEEAQRVFVNAVCYISQFAGKVPVGRKYGNGCVTRKVIQDQLALFEDKSYEAYKQSVEEYNFALSGLKRQVDSLQVIGEKVSGDLEGLCNPSSRVVLDREAFLKKYLGREMMKVGIKDVEGYRRYLLENKDYFYGGAGDFNFTVDEDLKRLGIPVGCPEMLHRAVELLDGSAAEQETGRRLLRRYTLKDYSSVAEWRNWLERVKGNLFFSESCGYKFMENGGEMNTGELSSPMAGSLQGDNPVSVSCTMTDQEVVVRFKMAAGFHIYSASGEEGAYVLTKVEFGYPEGIRPVGKLIAPAGKAYEADPKVQIYEGEVVFRQPVSVDVKGKGKRVSCTVTYQACDNTICLPPETEEVGVVLGGGKK